MTLKEQVPKQIALAMAMCLAAATRPTRVDAHRVVDGLDFVRRILLELYSNSPGGMPGNDDGGAMGSYVVFSAIGLFPEIPGVAGFVVGSPLFTSISVRLANGSRLEITAPSASDANRYVQDLFLDGCGHNSPWIPWTMVSNGARLHFRLAGAPNMQWGSDPSAAPPSLDTPDAAR